MSGASRNKARPTIARIVAAVALLMKQPRTVRELGQALDLYHADDAAHYIALMHGEGMLYIAQWRQHRSTWTAVYAWQGEGVCAMPDAPRPARVDPATRKHVARAGA
jgi:hypothetical protein